ncbi:MAG: segregation/condensation protein A [Thermosynechococcaceae cyanobacterium MS004]|nr:segregation/condensation protein A [Thermosynechococcaceae cyanobacterium MS004]
MSQSFADDAIALLIDLAQRGEIDAWDVNVVEVFDRFLSELTLKDSQDLATSGQAFLYASMLILLKAESLAGLNPPEEILDDGLEGFEGFDLVGQGRSLPANLEQHLHRRPVAHPYPKRRVTLGELIQQLELIAVAVERQSKQAAHKKVVRPSRAQSIKAISQLSHVENLTEVAAELELMLAELGFEQNWIDFEALMAIKNDRVGFFWALLLLSAQSKIELDQQEFYQDLRLRPFRPAVNVELPVLGLPVELPLSPDLDSAAS